MKQFSVIKKLWPLPQLVWSVPAWSAQWTPAPHRPPGSRPPPAARFQQIRRLQFLRDKIASINCKDYNICHGHFHKEIGNVSALMIKPVISVQRTLNWIIYSSGLKNCRGKSHTLIPLKRFLNSWIKLRSWLCQNTFVINKYRSVCVLVLFVFSTS